MRIPDSNSNGILPSQNNETEGIIPICLIMAKMQVLHGRNIPGVTSLISLNVDTSFAVQGFHCGSLNATVQWEIRSCRFTSSDASYPVSSRIEISNGNLLPEIYCESCLVIDIAS